VAGKYRKFTPEFREEAARMVVETSRPIVEVARELGVNETSVGNWVRAYREKHAGDELRCSFRSGRGCGNLSGRTASFA
jgi:transposase